MTRSSDVAPMRSKRARKDSSISANSTVSTGDGSTVKGSGSPELSPSSQDESLITPTHDGINAPNSSSVLHRSRPKSSSRPLLLPENEQDENTFTPTSARGVVLLNRLPHGFLEPQLRRFFSQFGEVTRLRLVRSKKTGNSKGYAFIEFALKEVAAIVAETMNNYIMFGVSLRARLLPRDKVPEGVFTNYIKHPKRGWAVDKQRELHNRSGSITEVKVNRLLQKEEKRNEKLRTLGIKPVLSLASIKA